MLLFYMKSIKIANTYIEFIFIVLKHNIKNIFIIKKHKNLFNISNRY
jgi:hypothetical protein